MTRSRNIGSTIRRAAAVLVLLGVALASTAAPTHAQALTGGGRIFAQANCYLASHGADVNVFVLNPSQFDTSGMVYYTQLWARPHGAANWTLIKGEQSQVIRTPRIINGPYTIDPNPAFVFGGTFYGRGSYDIFINWWSRLPGSATWSPAYGFQLATDPHSFIQTISNNGYGSYYSQTVTCNL
jgi:hypothetical protein